MKGLNVKRIAALGIGAALVGSALAPAVMAGVFSNVDSLQKTSIVNSTGTPVVDIVVGSMGQAADVVWAGNIAAKVAQLATVDATTGAPTVDLIVGGTTSMSGDGLTVESAIAYNAAETDFQNIQVTDSKMSTLVNNTSADLTWNGSDITTSVKEVLKGTANVEFQGDTGSSKYAAGEVYASVNSGDLNYSVELGTGLDISTTRTGLDANADVDVKLPWLGKTYVLDEIKAGSSLVMYADTTPTDLKVGEKLSVTPASGYAGKTMEIELVDLIQVGSGNTTYEPKWALLIDGVATKYVQKGANTSYDLRSEFGKSYFMDNVYVTSAGLNLAANTYTATIRTGNERIELKNGKGYPFTDDSTIDDKAQWKVVFDNTTTLTKISLVNQWSYKKTSGSETDTAKYVLKTDEAVVLPNDFAEFKFAGLQDKATTELLVGDVDGIDNGGIQYIDLRGNTVKVPFYTQFDMDWNNSVELSIAGKDFTFWTDTNGLFTGGTLYYTEGKHSDAVSHAGWSAVDFNNNTVSAGLVALDLGAETKAGAQVLTNYKFVDSNADGIAALVLAPQTFNIQNKANSTSVAKLQFVDSNNGLGYYMPYTEDFVETLLNLGSSAFQSKVHSSARLLYTDNASYPVSLSVEATDTAKVWEYKSLNNSDNVLIGLSSDANSADWALGEDVTNPLSMALTQDGTIVESDGSVFTLMVPDETRNAEVYLGSTGTTSSTTGGATYNGVAVGGTEGNVTVKAINGAAGKTVVSVGNIVKLDTDAVSGKAIIVGGHLVNNMAANLSVEGQTLQERLVANGDYVAAVLDNGSVVVAGWNANDTASAARALIAQLESFM